MQRPAELLRQPLGQALVEDMGVGRERAGHHDHGVRAVAAVGHAFGRIRAGLHV